MEPKRLIVGAVVFPGWDILDLCGPFRLLGSIQGMEPLPKVEIYTITSPTQTDKLVKAHQNITAKADFHFNDKNIPTFNVLLIPGWLKNETLLKDQEYLNFLKAWIPKVEYVLTVCIGSILVAATGLLDGKQATTNKQAIKYAWDDLVISTGPNVKWSKVARWVVDDKFYTASGVAAGMDMALDFIREIYGEEVAIATAQDAEYDWHQDPHYDPFAKKLGLSDSKDSDLGYFI